MLVPKEAEQLAEAMEANVARGVDFYVGIGKIGVKATGDIIEGIKKDAKQNITNVSVATGEALASNVESMGAAVLEASKTTKKSGKEKASDTPSWSKGKKPKKDEDRNKFLDRIFDEQYGEGNWSKKSREYSQLKKAFDRGGL